MNINIPSYDMYYTIVKYRFKTNVSVIFWTVFFTILDISGLLLLLHATLNKSIP